MRPTRDSPKRVDRFSPSNGRANGAKKSMGGAILTYDHHAPAKRLGKMAPAGDRGTQPSDELHDQDDTKRSIVGVPPSIGLSMESGNHSPLGGRPHGSSNATTGASENGAQPGGPESAREPIPPKRKGLARRQESSPALSDAQASPQTSWPVPYHGTDFTRRLQTRSSPGLDHP